MTLRAPTITLIIGRLIPRISKLVRGQGETVRATATIKEGS